MKIGCVKEIKNNEFRVGLTPDNVKSCDSATGCSARDCEIREWCCSGLCREPDYDRHGCI